MNIWTGGTFDLLHPGHIVLLREARRLAEFDSRSPGHTVTVAVNTEDFVARFKTAPVQPLLDRITMVRAISYVDETQINDGTDQAGLILAAKADAILIGDDWAPPKDYLAQLGITFPWLDQHHIDIRYLPRSGGYSSTRLKAEVSGRRLG